MQHSPFVLATWPEAFVRRQAGRRILSTWIHSHPGSNQSPYEAYLSSCQRRTAAPSEARRAAGCEPRKGIQGQYCVATNGTLIRKVKHKILGKPAVRQMNFSLHSFDGHAGSTNREQYLTNIISFVREAAGQNILFSFRLWNLDQDHAEGVIHKIRNVLCKLQYSCRSSGSG